MNEQQVVDDIFGTNQSDELLTRDGGPIKLTPALRDKFAIYRSGLILVEKNSKDSNEVISAISLYRRKGFLIKTPPKLVDLGALRAAYTKKDLINVIDESSKTKMKSEMLGILIDAGRVGTSDVHLVVSRGETMLYFRTDGERRPYLESPWSAEYGHQLCRTAYAMADVADSSYSQFSYQAARISTGLPDFIQAVRCQFNPVGFDGRQLVMRLLYNKVEETTTLKTLGFSDDHIKMLDRLGREPVGIVVVSGPTGSGKSTTLERLLSKMVGDFPGDHILSVEDPPEYVIPGVVQLPVSNATTDEQRANAFTEAIAAAMRSDPDRMMIGEVRTKASASLAFKAALTGHTVYTTLHSNDSLAIITRLIDIGIEGYMVRDPSLVRGMLAQRLVRALCNHCKINQLVKDLENQHLSSRLINAGLDPEQEIALVGGGCAHCRAGFKGRTVVAEMIIPDQRLLRLLSEGLREEAEAYWMGPLKGVPMLSHALDKIRAGILDPDEAERKLGRFE